MIVFLISTQDGRFISDISKHVPYLSLSLIPRGRPQNWRELTERDLITITYYHHRGDKNVE